jgi:hypothetical protein
MALELSECLAGALDAATFNESFAQEKIQLRARNDNNV